MFPLGPESLPPIQTAVTSVSLQGGQGPSPTPTALLPGSASRLPAAPVLPGAAGPGLPGASVRGRLQLHAVQQLRPLLLPHAALHQRPPAHMRSLVVGLKNSKVEALCI